VSGFDIDQLALDSAPGGGPMPLASPTTLAPPAVTPAPAVHVDSATSTTLHLTVHGLREAVSRGPVDLVLGESIDSGWTASVVGGRSLGPPVLIDGFANGWPVTTASLGSAAGRRTASIVLTWQPQKGVDLAVVISLAALVVCLVLALLPSRRRRRGRHSRAGPGAAPVAPRDSAPTQDLPVEASADGPRLAVPFRADGRRAPVVIALISGLVAGGVAAAVTAPAVGLAVGGATALVLLVPRLRILLGLMAVAGIAAAGLYVAVHQHRAQVLANGNWPLSFEKASRLAWAGVVFLGADGLVGAVLDRRQDPTDQPDPAE
jgi:hypothetical protein